VSPSAHPLLVRRLLGAVTALVVLTAAPAHAAAPKITGTSHAPLVAAAGDRIAVTATLSGAGRRVALGLVLGNAQGSATGGIALSATATKSARRRVVVRGRVPATVAPGLLGTLLVCIDPAGAIKGVGTCRTAARIATSGTSVQERLAGARQAGRLSKANGILFGLRALRGKTGVPAELRGGLDGPGGEEAAIVAAGVAAHGLPASVRKQVLPFFVPPRGQGSAWAPGPKRAAKSKRHRARGSAAATLDCTGYAKLDVGYFSGNKYPWRGVPTSDGKAIVWYQANADLPAVEAAEQASARHLAKVLPKIWTTLTKEFGPPLSDGHEACYHGPDGRYDVYVDSAVVEIESRFARGVLALTIPYPANGTNFTCSHRPSWIAVRAGISDWALAHEFMHALQLSHRTAACAGANAWWTEGQANWGGDFVYPDDNTEQRDWPQLVTEPLATHLADTDYEAWPFWMMLSRTQGVGVLRSIFTGLASKPLVAAVDGAIPGGFAKQLPRFFLHALNQSPIGDAGFEIPQSFAAWDHWNANPSPPAAVTLSLGSQPADTLTLPIQRAGFPPLSVGAYQRVSIPDDNIKELRFTNDLAGKPGAHVDALLHLADGSWKLADWTAQETVTLCRTRPAEDARELIIVSTNAGQTALAGFTHQLHVSPDCALPTHFEGTWTRVITYTGIPNHLVETVQGRATYDLDPNFPASYGTFTSLPYNLVSGSVHWTMAADGCTSQSGDADLATSDSRMSLEDVTANSAAPKPEPRPFYYAIRAEGDGQNAPTYDFPDCQMGGGSISVFYLDIGYGSPFTASAPMDKIKKSASATLLAGHATSSESSLDFDDTWSFTGSG
jgi:hypothetical protein